MVVEVDHVVVAMWTTHPAIGDLLAVLSQILALVVHPKVLCLHQALAMAAVVEDVMIMVVDVVDTVVAILMDTVPREVMDTVVVDEIMAMIEDMVEMILADEMAVADGTDMEMMVAVPVAIGAETVVARKVKVQIIGEETPHQLLRITMNEGSVTMDEDMIGKVLLPQHAVIRLPVLHQGKKTLAVLDMHETKNLMVAVVSVTMTDVDLPVEMMTFMSHKVVEGAEVVLHNLTIMSNHEALPRPPRLETVQCLVDQTDPTKMEDMVVPGMMTHRDDLNNQLYPGYLTRHY